MSILIKGMEMPTSCGQCKLKTVVGLDKEKCLVSGVEFYSWDTGWGDEQRRHESCPLVPVPPHGRLIDADAFADEMKKRQEEAGRWLREAKDRETAVRADAVLSFLCEVKLTLDAAPTIIEAEEGER